MEIMQEKNLINTEKLPKFFTDEERKKKTRKEFNKYKKIIKPLEESSKKIIFPLIDNLAFLVVMQEELKCIINRDGYFEEYQNGKNQTGIKRTVASDLLLQAQKNYSMFYKQFKDSLPSNALFDDMDDWDKQNEL